MNTRDKLRMIKWKLKDFTVNKGRARKKETTKENKARNGNADIFTDIVFEYAISKKL